MKHADLIVVGAGSAGCVLAARLARGGFRVTLIEPPATTAPRIDRERPSRWLNLLGSSEDWDLRTEPSAALASRSLHWPRGRGLGGSSRINAMIWFPPTDHDSRMLVEAGGGRWTSEELLAAYQSVCTLVQPQRPLWLSESSKRFLSAVRGTPDARPIVYLRANRHGRRWNPADLLEPESRVKVVRATVDRIIWQDDRAVGVRVISGASAGQLRAAAGVVLCAGAISTPTILMRSGIGPRDELARHQITPRGDLGEVGENLQDHLIMPVIFQTRSSSSFTATPTVRDIARWQSLGIGPIGSNLAECGGLFKEDTLQFHVTPTHYLTYPQTVAPVMTVGVNVTQPKSRGRITLGSRKHDDPPLIDPGYLSHKSDLDGTIQGVRLARLLASNTDLSDWITAEQLPGPKRQSDRSIAKSIARYAQTLYHPSGTCRLGCDSSAVVDAGFAVTAARQLWVVDASILPALTVGNPNAMVMTLASMAVKRIASAMERS